jgi:predicted homoserine dehydrogenase-like protein
MSKTIKVALAGAGAFGIKHLDGIKNIDGVEVVSWSVAALTRPRKWPTNTASSMWQPIWPKAWRCPKSMP